MILDRYQSLERQGRGCQSRTSLLHRSMPPCSSYVLSKLENVRVTAEPDVRSTLRSCSHCLCDTAAFFCNTAIQTGLTARKQRDYKAVHTGVKRVRQTEREDTPCSALLLLLKQPETW